MTVYVQSSLKLLFAFHSVSKLELRWRLKMTDSSMSYNQGLTDPPVWTLVRDQAPIDVEQWSVHRWLWNRLDIDIILTILVTDFNENWFRCKFLNIVLVTGYAIVGCHHSNKVTKISYMWPSCHQHSCRIYNTLVIFNRDFIFSFSICSSFVNFSF